MLRYILFHHQTTTRQNYTSVHASLRYILFHHQTTTTKANLRFLGCCVISSFITKPQLSVVCRINTRRCVISSFITKPQLKLMENPLFKVALYPLSSPNHNTVFVWCFQVTLRYILFHHQTTTLLSFSFPFWWLRYILFHHQTTTWPFWSFPYVSLRYILFHHQTTTAQQ